jgi:putative transposase
MTVLRWRHQIGQNTLDFRRMSTLQKFASAHASVQNHLNTESALYSRSNFNPNRTAALAELRRLGAA